MKDNTKLLERNWKWGPSGLILRKWSVDFNAFRSPHNIQNIWVILSGLPMVFWQPKLFEAIGNKLGNFIATEENWEENIDRRCAQILVEMDLRDGLYEELKIVMHGSVWW